MPNVRPQFNNKARPVSIFSLNKQPIRAAWKNNSHRIDRLIKDMYMNSQQLTTKGTKNDICWWGFFKSPTFDKAMFSGHFQQLKKKEIERYVLGGCFSHKSIWSKTFIFLISQTNVKFGKILELIVQFRAQKGGTETISSRCLKQPSSLLILSLTGFPYKQPHST